MGTVADDICIVRSMHTEAINHDPAHTFMNTGSTVSGRPSMGSWVWYGLGSEADNLPGFRGADQHRQQRAEAADRRAHVAQRVPAQQVPGRAFPLARVTPVLYVSTNPAGVSAEQQRDVIDAVE